MTARRRLSPAERRGQLLDVGARLFAAKPYDDVLMEDVAERAGISRALLYRYFPGKRDLFAAVYRQAADQLLAATRLDRDTPLTEQLAAGLDAHIDYFLAHRNTVLAANRVLAGDPVIQAVITDELAVLRARLLDATPLGDGPREAVAAALMSWLVFVRTLCVDWLTHRAFSRTDLREMCIGALLGALGPVVDLDAGAATGSRGHRRKAPPGTPPAPRTTAEPGTTAEPPGRSAQDEA
ncbi:helix-turn-helix domain-containing protein [Streptomyces sp. NPDC020742]|uniref:TetR/AcrR family transcriptional regulator n=1 Tax=unclassified Streptomyces TaxID=2593676 RepID=UPI0033D16086